jgi:hypothetical protein
VDEVRSLRGLYVIKGMEGEVVGVLWDLRETRGWLSPYFTFGPAAKPLANPRRSTR